MQTKKKIKITLIIILMLAEVFTIHLMYKSTELKDKELPKAKIKNENNISKEQFAIMLEKSAGSKEYENKDADYPDALPTEGYKFNSEKSGCIDVNGKEVKNVLDYDYGNYILTLTPSNTVYCYLYYDVYSPTITITKTNDEYDSIAVQVNVSGNVEVDKYYYSIDSETNYTELSTNTYTFTGLEEGTTYKVRVYVKDSLGIISGVKDQDLATKEKPKLDASKLITEKGLWNSGLEGDGYRYTGTTPDNYICFGTTDQTQCKNNTDAYMYRIIGVFEDTSGNKHMKLIKKEALNTSLAWNTSNSDADWVDSTLYSSLNGSEYLTNTTYMPSGWSDKIATWTWSAVNTLTNENSGPNYYSITTQQMYLHEMNRNNKTSSVGEWATPRAKIGLMYASDYQMSLGSSALNYISSSNSSTLKTGWMHISNNDTSDPGSGYEWTMSRSGLDSSFSYYYAWFVFSEGYVNSGGVYYPFSARPVFYLESDEVIKDGTGTLEDPYILR